MEGGGEGRLVEMHLHVCSGSNPISCDERTKIIHKHCVRQGGILFKEQVVFKVYIFFFFFIEMFYFKLKSDSFSYLQHHGEFTPAFQISI